MRNVLITDTETQGLKPEHQVIEVGALLFSVEHMTTLAQMATLLPAIGGNPAEKVNKIPAAAVASVEGCAFWGSGLLMLGMMQLEADVIVAHRAEFDRPRLAALDNRFDGKPWVCSKFDFVWPGSERQGGSLVNIVLDHGLGVSHAHRAMTDCINLARLFECLGRDWLEEQIKRGLRPKGLFSAILPYDRRQEAKDASFEWHDATDPDMRLKKQWVRRMALEDAAVLPFQTRRIE